MSRLNSNKQKKQTNKIQTKVSKIRPQKINKQSTKHQSKTGPQKRRLQDQWSLIFGKHGVKRNTIRDIRRFVAIAVTL